MPHYIADAVRLSTGEPGVLIIYAPSLEEAKQKTVDRHLIEVVGELIERRPTEEEWQRGQSVSDGVRFSGFEKEEAEPW